MTANNGGGVISQINELKNQLEVITNQLASIQPYIIPVGTVIAVANSVPTGFLLCNGQSVSRDTYADLFEYLGTKYGSDSDDTFKVPNYTNIFLQGSNNNVGTTIAAGLPNITGMLVQNTWVEWMQWRTGCFYQVTQNESNGNVATNNSNTGNAGGVGFNASRSSSIYGKSNTVQPPAVTVNFCIKY